LLYLFVAIGLVAFASALYGILAQVQLLAIIRNGRATAVDLAVYLGLDSLEELDALREAHPDLLRVVPGPPGTYEHVEFTFSSRRVKALRRKSRMSWIERLPVRLVSVLLLLAALVLGHERTAGWLVLLAAVLVEALRWVVTRSTGGGSEFDEETAVAMGEPIYESDGERVVATSSAVDRIDDAEPEEFGEPIYEEDEPAAFVEAIGGDDDAAMSVAFEPAPALRTFTTIVLLRQPWRPAESPIVGGLRRAGQRDAVGASAKGGAPDRVRLKCSDIIVNVVNHPEKVDADTLAFAVNQSWHWPEAAAASSAHVAHLTIASSHGANVRPADLVRLHHRAHLAVSEFAPVVAALWPASGRLTGVDELPALASRGSGLLETCVTFRAYDSDSEVEGGTLHVIDTVGLSALAGADLEWISGEPPSESVSAALADLAERLFSGEMPAAEGDVLEWPGVGQVGVVRRRSQFSPDREVLGLERA